MTKDANVAETTDGSMGSRKLPSTLTNELFSNTESWASRQVAAMSSAWERGERITAAEILERYPDLDTEAAIRLIYEEVCLRREAGLEVDTEEVVLSHPRWGAELRDLFDCDRLLGPAQAPAPWPELGDVLGPFRLLAELGRGASGRTYLAVDPRLADRAVVVKVIPDDQDEHLALARLQHTYIVPLFSEHAFPDRQLRGLCMPYLGGASLAQILNDLADIPLSRRSGKLLVDLIDRNTRATPPPPSREGPFRRSLEQATYSQAISWITACLADALHYAHARGLVHMDVKPSNVLITADGQPMLLDFHLARGPVTRGDWISGRLGGTPGWMSPEQENVLDAADHVQPAPASVDGRTDIFALGVLLREALAGPPPTGAAGKAKASRTLPGISVGLADILRKSTAPHPNDRYADAATFADDLRRHVNDLPLRGVGNRSPLERWHKWRRRRPGALPWAMMTAAIVLMLGAALAVAGQSYRQRVDQLWLVLEDGRRQYASRHYEDSVRTLSRGLSDARTLPAVGSLRHSLGEELQRSQRAQMAEELHSLAELIRYRHGVDLPKDDDGATLLRHCQAIFAQRGRLLPAANRPVPGRLEQRIKTDLLELAAISADLRMRLAPANAQEEARLDALRILDEARTTCGPSLALELRRNPLANPTAPHGNTKGTLTPTSAWEHYDVGRYFLRAGRFDSAINEFRQVLAQRPQDFWSNFYQGLCSFRLGQFEDAVSAFRACATLAPRTAICRYNRALAYQALGKNDLAYDDYTRAIELDPALVPAPLNRGILSYKRGRPLEAIADFERALSVHPADRELVGRLQYNLALAQLAQGDRTAALASAQEAIRQGSHDAQGVYEDILRADRASNAPKPTRIPASASAAPLPH